MATAASSPREVARYHYCDAQGRRLYDKVKTDPKGYYREPNGADSSLYHLELLDSTEGSILMVSESEKDADCLLELAKGDVVAVASGGADNWSDAWADAIAKARPRLAVILAHNDDAGRKFSTAAAYSLSKRGLDVKVLSFDGPEGYDVADAVRDGLSFDDLLERVDRAPTWTGNEEATELPTRFKTLDDGRYQLIVPDIDVTFEIDRLRRQRHDLVGELSVRCGIAGARTVDGMLSIADFNLSTARTRVERAKILASQSQAKDIDWFLLLEEFCQRVLTADRAGKPLIDLRTVPLPAPDDMFQIDGLRLPRRHPNIVFGDGGAAKSYLGLYLAGRLAKDGQRVALFDWELAAEDHRARLERLFGPEMPVIHYARCERPLVDETDRLRRYVHDNAIDYCFYDSVAFACDGPPEAAEVAGRYFRAVRQIGGGSTHIAHVSKADAAEARQPFGSVFWHNSARSTWFAKLAEATPGGDTIQLGLYNRKINLGALQPAIGFEIAFTDDQTHFHRIDIATVADLATKLPVRQRMVHALRKGAMTPDALAKEIDAKTDTVRRTAKRYREQFVVLDGGYFGLAERTP